MSLYLAPPPSTRSENETNSPLHDHPETLSAWLSISNSWFDDHNTNNNFLHTNHNVLLTSANHSVIHSPASNFRIMPPYTAEDLHPDIGFLQRLLAGLLLSTALVCCAAYDANRKCRSAYAYDVHSQLISYDDDASSSSSSSGRSYNDDNINESEEEAICQEMFQKVVIPVGTIVFVCTIASFRLLRRLLSTSTHQSVTKDGQGHLGILVNLALVIVAILAAWTYGIVAIMLRPRNAQNNAYQSLAAVDSMGHVGENANLYYTAWISLGLSLALAYQVCGDLVRQCRRKQLQRVSEASHVGDIETMLSSLTVFQLETYRESRAMWYKSLYRLRTRTGIWTSSFVATLIVMTSSVHIWHEVLIPTAFNLNPEVSYQDVCSILVSSDLPSSLCARTAFSLFSGVVAAILSFGAIVTHWLVRRGAARMTEHTQSVSPSGLSLPSNVHGTFRPTTLPLHYEFVLAVVLSNMLGLNAVVATAVQGPAATVGNLYYANWISFLLCLRICLGCLEELCNMNDESESPSKGSTGYEPPAAAPSSGSTNHSNANVVVGSSPADEIFANERSQRRRLYLFLGISSTVCSASAFDAAMYESNSLHLEQHFVISAPALVAVVSACQFLLCLRTSTYRIVSQIWLGGLLSVLTCIVCLVTLVITMHSEFSWAVNGIGEIKIANLYYFTWASTIAAGLILTSYIKSLLGLKQKDFVTAIWMAICKICFIILAAGYHVWHNISDACTVDDIRSGAVTFCSRTLLSIAVAFTGMITAGLIVLIRILSSLLCPNSKQPFKAHMEMGTSVVLVLLFASAVALITGIGGPGQSVGDLFYATWFAFLVSLALVAACFDEIRQLEREPVLIIRREEGLV